MCVCVCVCVCVGWGLGSPPPTTRALWKNDRALATHTSKARPKSQQAARIRFCEKLDPTWRGWFRGSKRGPRRGYYSGIRGAPNRARPAFWGHILMRNTKNDVFGNTKNAKIFLRRRYGAGVKNKVSDRRYMASETNGKVGFLRVHRRYTSAFFASFGPLFLGFPGQIPRRGTNIEHF